MSLIKQLWLTIALVVVLAFGGSLAICITATRHYIEQEVRIKNADNAYALALTMSQLQKDPVIVELLLAAQFDTGHYRRLELLAPNGDTILRRQAVEAIEGVPAWFVALARFEVPVGRATVQDGWRQYGTIEVQSQHNYAYRVLWDSILRLVGWFALATLLSGLLAWWVVRCIRRPLHAVIGQARDIGERRFTRSPEPRTRELREVVVAMNRLSDGMRTMLTQESEKLEELRRKLQQDEVTGAANRGHFMTRLQTALDGKTAHASGALAMLRIANLAALNERLGHQATDRLLAELVDALHAVVSAHGSGSVGRLNGSDLALLLPGDDDIRALTDDLKARLHPIADAQRQAVGVPIAVTHYHRGDQSGALLSLLDGELAKAEYRGDRGTAIVADSIKPALYTRHDDWRQALERAFHHGLQLARYPVLDARGAPLHHETSSRLHLAGEWQPAATFMPWITRLDLATDLDLGVTEAALTAIEQQAGPLAINLSPKAAGDARLLVALKRLLQAHPEAAAELWLEMPEAVAIRYLEGFKALCLELRRHGCRMGLEHVGPEFARIADLQEAGLSYLKFDASLVRGIDTHPDQQALLRGKATLCHSLGILAIAEGVTTEAERVTLFEIGLDGVTGPGIRWPEDTPPVD